jgi:hypothetical protein
MRIDQPVMLLLMVVGSGFPSFMQKSSTAADVPSFYAAPPESNAKLPPLLMPSQPGDFKGLTDEYQRIVKIAYRAAFTVSDVIYQQPCYCRCDRMVGHKSLRSCYQDQHAMHCDTCLKELFYAYESKKRGRTAEEIRTGITAGEWQTIDLNSAASHAEKDLAKSK